MTTKKVRFQLADLEKPARILIDRWGIPHIKAETKADLFFAQGFNIARDRLWQIDLWRKRGLGLLAADFGPGYLAQDQAARLFLYRGDMAAEWRSYAEDAQEICTAFVGGINAFIAAIDRKQAPLPPEFTVMGTKPERWAAEDVVRVRSHGLTANAQSEIARAVLLAAGQDDADRLRQERLPDLPLDNPGRIDLARIPARIIDRLRLASAPVSFSRERLAARLEDAWRWSIFDDFGVTRDSQPEGSNSWVVHGSKTTTGRPILASDPHRVLSLPSIRYLAHLSGPGIEAIGAGEPCLPGISIGHNERIAFGLTIFDADQEDVYIYETDPKDPLRYRFGDSFERMTTRVERFEVKGSEPQEQTHYFTRHGPVVFTDPGKALAIAVRSVWAEPGAAPYLASLSTMRAGNFAEFDQALARWKTPSVNKTYADIDGHIAWTPAGYVPRRTGWSGMLPVPGSGGFEWKDNLDRTEMPRLIDPEIGFVATANEFNLPADWDHQARPVGFEWTSGARAMRIREVLSRISVHDLSHSQGLQTDIRSIPALRLQRLLTPLSPTDAGARQARALILDWNGDMNAESAAAALYGLWWLKHLRPATIAALAPELGSHLNLVGIGHADALLAVLEGNSAQLAPVMAASLASAWREALDLIGPDPSRWRWGQLHQMLFRSPVAAVTEKGFTVGPFLMGGDNSTPMNTSPRVADWRVASGASVRLVMDVGDWDKSLCINTPGQSGDPASAHYADLAALWAKGDYVPLLFSPAAVEAATETVIDLVPM
ncbi:penicillin acylase family protein [Aestuariivirga sp. YIM B02566]|uniref:penicillin acylase family protein n=1 Tax=Taklimakanibacter albus TaxID=2800327 RepID=UPI0032B1D421